MCGTKLSQAEKSKSIEQKQMQLEMKLFQCFIIIIIIIIIYCQRIQHTMSWFSTKDSNKLSIYKV